MNAKLGRATSESTSSSIRDAGYAVVLTALILIPLMGFAGFAIDVGYWYSRASAEQKAADAAALAGVVWLPDVAVATTTALEIARLNGFDNADPDITVSVTETGPQELTVSIVDNDVDLFFAGLFLDNVSIGREAVSEYVKSVPMGNPENYLGTDPERGISEQNYLSISGARTDKRGGDRFAGKDCHATETVGLCSLGTDGNLPSNGGEFKEENYLYSTRITTLQPFDLVIEAYDPAQNKGTQTCADHGNFPVGYDFNDLYTAGGLVAMFPGDGTTQAEFVAHYQDRYANAPGAIYCTGDTPSGPAGAISSYYIREPDDTPFNDLDNPIIDAGECVPEQFPEYDEDFYGLLEQVGTAHAYADTFAAQFRRWYELCRIPAGAVEVGDYIIQIRTNASLGNPTVYDPAYNQGARNHFSLRAGWDNGGSFPDGTGVEVFANGHMAIDVNVPAASTVMELARITPEYAGRELAIELWDVGDASNPGTLTILPPAESPSTFTNCTITNTKVGWTDPDPTDCGGPVTYADMNGHLLTINVPVPSGYTCDDTSNTGCFIRVSVVFPPGTTVYDHTTWSVRVIGDPIRLIE